VIRVAQILLLTSAAALWVASRLPWVSVTSFDGLTHPVTTTLNGAQWSTALLPMAVLLAAAALAALAARGWLLRVVALLLAAVCLALGYLGVSLITIPDVAPRGAELTGVQIATLVDSERYLPGAVVTLAAAVGALAAAVLLMRAAGSAAHQADRSTEYTAPGADGTSDPDLLSERGIWDALDEGRDPTGDSEGR
jgi:uncharacterized membrane protein (TIGR02234 family)